MVDGNSGTSTIFTSSSIFSKINSNLQWHKIQIQGLWFIIYIFVDKKQYASGIKI